MNGEAATPLDGQHSETRQPMDVGLLGGRDQPSVLGNLHHRVGTGPGIVDPVILGRAHGVAHQVGRPEGVHLLEEVRVAHREGEDGAHTDLQVVLSLQLHQAAGGQIGVRTSKRPEDVQREAHALFFPPRRPRGETSAGFSGPASGGETRASEAPQRKTG